MKIVPRVFLQSTLLCRSLPGALSRMRLPAPSTYDVWWDGQPAVTRNHSAGKRQANNDITGSFSYNPLQHGVNGVYTFTGTGPDSVVLVQHPDRWQPASSPTPIPGGDPLLRHHDQGYSGTERRHDGSPWAMTGGTSGPRQTQRLRRSAVDKHHVYGSCTPGHSGTLQPSSCPPTGHLVWDPPAVTAPR